MFKANIGTNTEILILPFLCAVYVCLSVCVSVCMYVYLYMCASMHLCMCVCMYIYVCMYSRRTLEAGIETSSEMILDLIRISIHQIHQILHKLLKLHKVRSPRIHHQSTSPCLNSLLRPLPLHSPVSLWLLLSWF